MKGTAIILKPGDTLDTATRIGLMEPPSLEFLQASVDGDVENVPGWSAIKIEGHTVPCVALCNEEGKLKGLHGNTGATALWRQIYRSSDCLVGPVVVLTGDPEFMESL